MATVFFVDVLDDFFAAFVFEINVDVGWLAAFFADKAFKEQIDAGGIDAGDAQAVAHCRIGGGSATLAEDALGAGESDDVVDGEEIFGVVEFFDESEFVFDAGDNVGGDLGGEGEEGNSARGGRGRRRSFRFQI